MYDTYISGEVVHFIDSAYNTLAQKKSRAISGLSMGGHGALYLALRHPEVFGAAGSMSGVLNLEHIVNSHYIRSLQSSYLFYGICTIVFFGISLQSPLWFQQVGPYLLYVLILYYLVRFGLLYVFTNSSGQFINLYLFSYLCVLEIIPLIIGVKFAI